VPRIHYAGGRTVEVDLGESVLDGSLRHGIAHQHACGGNARCTTCRVEVQEGLDGCPEPRPDEREALATSGLEPPIRLACQLMPRNDITVRVLMPEGDHAEPLSLGSGLVRELEVAVLFADIRNYTTFAARRLPYDVLHLLNRSYDLMCPIIERHKGRVVSFHGDGMLTLFADDGDPAAVRAVRCGLDILAACPRLDEYMLSHFGFELRMGMGIDFGRALVGQVGYHRYKQLAAIGDVVNTASRVQGLTKETGTSLLITEAVQELARGSFRLGRQFEADLRGKSGCYNVSEVLGVS
jgi:adenylate cyclase